MLIGFYVESGQQFSTAKKVCQEDSAQPYSKVRRQIEQGSLPACQLSCNSLLTQSHSFAFSHLHFLSNDPPSHVYYGQSFILARFNSLVKELKRRLPSLAATLQEQSSELNPALLSKQGQAGVCRPNGRMSSSAENKSSYLSDTISAYSPWGTPRSNTPKPGFDREEQKGATDMQLPGQRGRDHSVSHRHKISLRDYPKDCPSLRVQWFFAVDVRSQHINKCSDLLTEQTSR